MDTNITKRPEPIKSLNVDGANIAVVGYDGVTAIEPYDEIGQCGYVPWFNVWRGEVLHMKVNAAGLLTVAYFEPGECLFCGRDEHRSLSVDQDHEFTPWTTTRPRKTDGLNVAEVHNG